MKRLCIDTVIILLMFLSRWCEVISSTCGSTFFLHLQKIECMDLTQAQWTEQLAQDENAVIIDVRTPEEWGEGIIPNALMIDIYQGQGFIYKVDELDKSKNYYVYCKAGGRSAQACNIMGQLGFDKTFNLMGGFSQWTGPVSMPE